MGGGGVSDSVVGGEKGWGSRWRREDEMVRVAGDMMVVVGRRDSGWRETTETRNREADTEEGRCESGKV